jgi:hypothetical protein
MIYMLYAIQTVRRFFSGIHSCIIRGLVIAGRNAAYFPSVFGRRRFYLVSRFAREEWWLDRDGANVVPAGPELLGGLRVRRVQYR